MVRAPSDTVTGKATWYASTCRECPAGCGILAKNREGRVIKVEGNPFHPINQGRLCMRGQAALQGVYNPDRIKLPLLRDGKDWRIITYPEAEDLLREKAARAAKKGENRIRMVTETPGISQLKLFTRALDQWRSGPPLVYEPYAYEALKSANEAVFGMRGLPSYHMDEADFLVSFGADFLETWLSPVEYSIKFKKMHALKNGRKALFFHVGPYQSLTGTNADAWISCRPGSEVFIALGLIGHAVRSGRGSRLDRDSRTLLMKILARHTREKTIARSGIDPSQFDSLCTSMLKARWPLVLGTGSGTVGPHGAQTNAAVNLLNLILDPELNLIDFHQRHRVEVAAPRSEVISYFKAINEGPADILLLNNVNPLYSMPPGTGIKKALNKNGLFVVSFSNFMDETTEMADLVLPALMPLETWDEYAGKRGMVSTVQPTMSSTTPGSGLGDVLLRTALGDDSPSSPKYVQYLYDELAQGGHVRNGREWVKVLRRGGVFIPSQTRKAPLKETSKEKVLKALGSLSEEGLSDNVLIAAPSIRFFDGRGANKPWLCEVPDPLTRVAWETPVLMHPDALSEKGLRHGDILEIRSDRGTLKAPAYQTKGIRPGVMVMGMGQGHSTYGRYAENMGLNPIPLLAPETDPFSGGPALATNCNVKKKTDASVILPHTDGSRTQHGRKIALSVDLKELRTAKPPPKEGLAMWDFPLTLPLPEGYDRKRDVYPPHEHDTYRWAMVVDLDKCIGCGACSAACYAENNIAVTGPARILEGREMAWIGVERYEDPVDNRRTLFLPMLCQHCDNAPCESVCPVYAPHHSKEGLNNQIYNRCIGTRFCSQNCPYKVRRFNWFDWDWPGALSLQLNPDVTVRSKGVMEKCSFCIQRIKDARGIAKDENRKIMDGEIKPACLQTCPTGVFTFGNIMDPRSRVRKLVRDRRAYQVMGYLNTKPAVIYLKKVLQEI